MSDRGKRALTYIKNNEEIMFNLTNLLYKKVKLDYNDEMYLYSVAFLLIDEYKKNKEKVLFIEYAYYIIAVTSFKTNNYQALYDFSVNMGFYPLSRKILELNLLENETINHIISDAEVEKYNDGKKNINF